VGGRGREKKREGGKPRALANQKRNQATVNLRHPPRSQRREGRKKKKRGKDERESFFQHLDFFCPSRIAEEGGGGGERKKKGGRTDR